jgi:hypothetical protein
VRHKVPAAACAASAISPGVILVEKIHSQRSTTSVPKKPHLFVTGKTK